MVNIIKNIAVYLNKNTNVTVHCNMQGVEIEGVVV